jgi:hypothetical protein
MVNAGKRGRFGGGRTATKPQLAITAARAWAMAEAEGLILKSGEKLVDFRQSHPDVEPITEPGKHFALMFGVSPDYAYMARAVLAYSGMVASPLASRCSQRADDCEAGRAQVRGLAGRPGKGEGRCPAGDWKSGRNAVGRSDHIVRSRDLQTAVVGLARGT